MEWNDPKTTLSGAFAPTAHHLKHKAGKLAGRQQCRHAGRQMQAVKAGRRAQASTAHRQQCRQKAGRQAKQASRQCRVQACRWGWKVTLKNCCPEGDPCVALYMQLVLHMQGDSCVRKISEAKGNPGRLPKNLSHKGILAYARKGRC